ncbi:methyl-accepting chemotaxis sensory transducer with Pas/Pac sensor [Limnobacter thiooxidans]|uniref:Chemotaxis protein n=1 Tax=Limnobacter thiooxidans TaxID=131080 RepID=A0AA86M8A0_9BURK|nr:methyl-accepting chemotaxis protein [Limnobacter sp.]MCZ8017104.1 methyl-accepting chemotaxis protein [Limnobacter sp.]RZS37245.1 methyl-accepting chemotaxis sensory transducer with Pas/Pac sensor [Limnobacter thiooxidans]BET25499.1 hypothetical protein RGQ30_10000 [Limnobacter thiooxidans]
MGAFDFFNKKQITEQTEALEAMQRKLSECEFVLTAVSKAQAMIEFKMDGTIITANDNFLRTMGYTLDEIKGKHHSMFADTGVSGSIEYRQFWDKLNRGEYDAGQYRRIGKGGKEVWIEASYNPIMDATGKPYKVVKFATDITQATFSAIFNRRALGGLENVEVNVMLADANFNIVYGNASLTDMLRRAESDIRKDLPHFNASKIVGTNIDVFHKNPSHQRGMLANLKGTHKTELKVGSCTFDLTVNPIDDDHGARLGYVVEWRDRTAEVAMEAEISSVVARAAEGDFSERIREDNKRGFFKTLAQNVNGLLTTTSVGLEDVGRVLKLLANGNMTQKITANYKGLFGEVKDDVNATIDRLSDVIEDVRGNADSLTNAAREISKTSQSLSQGASSQAAGVEEVSASIEQMAGSIKQNSENSRVTDQIATKAAEEAKEGGRAVIETVNAMKAIAGKISIVDDIAYQTNLLALNAAIEAARAGEHGKGFAVVAAEVRKLAERSQVAAQEIGDLASSSVKQAERAGSLLQEMVPAINRTSDLVQEITAASNEQTNGVAQINQAMMSLNQQTQQNAAASEELAATAEEMSGQASMLNNAMSFFDTGSSRPRAKARPAERRPSTGKSGASHHAADAFDSFDEF